MVGTWKKGPGAELFEALEQGLGQVPILAEDLGVITPDVVALREVGAHSYPAARSFVGQGGLAQEPGHPVILVQALLSRAPTPLGLHP